MNLWNLTTSRTWVISWMLTFSPLVVLHDGFSRRIRLSKIGVRKPRKRKYSKISCLPVFLASSSVPTIPTASNERQHALRTHTNKSSSSNRFKILLIREQLDYISSIFLIFLTSICYNLNFTSYSSKIKITARTIVRLQYLYSFVHLLRANNLEIFNQGAKARNCSATYSSKLHGRSCFRSYRPV